MKTIRVLFQFVCLHIGESTLTTMLMISKFLGFSKTIFNKTWLLSSSSSSSLQNKLSGRWALDYDGGVQGRKVYWANMDNCGCCSSDNLAVVQKKDDAEDDEHILPYII